MAPLVDGFEGRTLHFANDEAESCLEMVAVKYEGETESAQYQFQLARDNLKKNKNGFLRVRGTGVLDWRGHVGGPMTRFTITPLESDESEGNLEVKRVLGKGLYIGVDPSGKVVPAAESMAVKLVPVDGLDDVAEKSGINDCLETLGKAASWICTPGRLSLSRANTKAFWGSILSALLTCAGSSLFWVGLWTEIDLAIPQTMTRDTIYIILGVSLSLLTGSFGLNFDLTPIDERFDQESMLLSAAKSADRRAADLERLAERGQSERALGQSTVKVAMAKNGAAKAREMAKQKREEAAQHTVWPWSPMFGYKLVTGDKIKDKANVESFLLIFGSIQFIVGLIGSTLLWIGLCNYVSFPIDFVVGICEWPFEQIYGFIYPDDGSDDTDYYVADEGVTHVKNTFVGFCEVFAAAALMNLSCGLDGISKVSCSIRDPYAWMSLLVGIFAGCTLWVAMSDLLETQFAIADESGTAAQPLGVWREMFYIVVGLLCQISTELVAGAAMMDEDYWHLPTLYDLVSLLGGVLLNSGVWTLLDTQMIGAWQTCSTDGILAPPDSDWPTCHMRNYCFFVVGLLILLRQRGEMDEAGTSSSPIMTLAVRSARKTARLEQQQDRQEEQKELWTVCGNVTLPGSSPENDPSDFLESVAGEVAELVFVPDERVETSIVQQTDDEVTVQINVLPITVEEVAFMRKFGVENNRMQEQIRVSKELKEKLSADGRSALPSTGFLANMDASGFKQLCGPDSAGFAAQQAAVAARQKAVGKARAKAKGKAKAKAKAMANANSVAPDDPEAAPKAKAKGKGKAKAKAGAGGSLEEPLLQE